METDDTAKREKTISRNPEKAVKPTRIVGIGASAGGLEAFTELLRHLPTNAGVAYVLVQHLDPTHRSLLSELLARVTTLPVREILPDAPVEPNNIYVIPPNTNLSVRDGILKLTARKANGGPARSIDHFLKSLAEDQKEKAIAVILSGAGSDGAQGLKAVKAGGGFTFAQDDTTAKYNSMPRAAAATGCVDFVLAPGKIAAEIARIIRHPHSTKVRAAANAKKRRISGNNESSVAAWGRRQSRMKWPEAPVDANLRKVFMLVRARTGTDFTYYKINTIRRRITRRIGATGAKDLEGYVRLLREQPGEIDTLYQDLLIHVSSFFRNPASYEILKRKIFPRMVKNHTAAYAMRIWVAGCSTGQEAYSIAMAFSEFSEQNSVRCGIQIFATDLNASVLETARVGRYSPAEVQNVGAARMKKFFYGEDGHYRVHKFIRDMVVFAQHNLLTDPPFTRVDLVACRNVLIYFDAALQEKLMPTFHYALNSDGFLWLGTSETIGQFTNLFATVEKSHRIYSKKATPTWVRMERPPSFSMEKGALPVVPFKPRPHETTPADAQKEADRLTLSQYSPPSVLVNDQLEVLQFRGEVDRFLALPRGKATYSVLKMARDGLSLPLQRLLQRAKKTNRPVREKGVTAGGSHRVDLEVVPLKNLKSRCYLIFFSRPPRSAKPGAGTELQLTKAGKREQAAQVKSRQELADTRERLFFMQEEHDTTVEELQASNEEVQSTNEELQSLNEELETSNEELESANEELTTLNEELATRNTELRESEQRLREQAQLLNMAPILARSPKGRIIFWSGGAEQMYGFTNEEALGQTANILLNTHFFEPLDNIHAKLQRDGHWEGEVQHRHKDGTILDIAVKWVAQKDPHNRLRAVLEVTNNITQRKDAERAQRASEEFNRTILESSVDSIKVLDLQGRIVYVNPSGQHVLQIADFKTVANLYWPNLWEGEGRSRAERAVRCALEGKVERFQAMRAAGDGPAKWWDVTVSPIYGAEEELKMLLTVARDITGHKEAEAQLRELARLAALRGEVASAVAMGTESRPTLALISEGLVKHLDVACAGIWTLKPGENVLELAASFGNYSHINGAHARIPLGNFRIGQIAAGRAPHSTNDIQNDAEMIEPEWVRREKFVAFAGYPLIGADKALGVVAVYSRQPLMPSALNELSFAAASMSQFIQRLQSQQSQAESQAALNRYAEDLEKNVEERTAALRQTIGELEAFSYSISHDVRGPLRAMDGYARALLDDLGDKLDPEHRVYLERISRGSRRLDQLTLDVLAYSRISRNNFNMERINLDKLIIDTVEQYPHLDAARDCIVVQRPLLSAAGNPAFLTQCVSNLLGNALKFVAPGVKPQIYVWTEARGNHVRLLVRDNGIGIAPEHRDRIFTIFGRVHHDKNYEGTGIGLAVVRRAVERMGGTIDFESRLGEGTTFWIELPSAEGVTN